jgi:DNA repair exonuclease SbcCD ATPase subunit
MAKIRSVTPRGAFVFGYDVPTLHLDQGGLVVLSGLNGTGKSSIMNSTVQSLFCKNDTPGDGDEIINHTLDDGCQIVTEFEAGGVEYTVEYLRKFRREGSKARETDLYLWENVDGKLVDRRGTSIGDTSKKIQKILGMDFDQFMATSYMGIQSASQFLNGTDAKRMDIITPFLGLGVWDDIQFKVRTLKKSVSDDLVRVKSQYDTITAQIETLKDRILSPEARQGVEAQIADLETQLEDSKIDLERELASSTEATNKLRVLQTDLDRLIAENIKSARDEVQVQNDLKRTVDRIKNSFPMIDRSESEKIRAEIAQAEATLKAALVGAQKELSTWNGLTGKLLIRSVDKSAKLMEQHNALDSQIIATTTMLNGLENSLAGVLSGEGECPTCHQIASSEHLDQVRAQIELDIQTKTVELEDAKKKQKTIFDKAIALAEAHKKSEIARITKTVEDANFVAPEVETFRARLVAEESRIRDEVREWHATQEKEATATAKTASAKINAAIDSNKTKIQNLKREITAIEADPTVLESRTKVESYKARIKALTEEIADQEQMLKDSDTWTKESERLDNQIVQIESTVKGLEVQLEDVEFLDRHTGDKGIKRFKLRDCIGFMNDRLAYYMGIMGLSMKVWFQDRELKKSAQKKKPDQLTDEDWADRFEIFIADGEKTGVPAGMYSGGERTLVSLAVLGTLWETANTFGSGGSNILMVDEPFGLLREDNRDRALSLFEYWSGLGKTVLVSDNTDTISRMRYNQMWELNKTNHVSQITVRDW